LGAPLPAGRRLRPDAFKERYAEAYAAFDAKCAELTRDERLIGEFEPA
jgi:hypothetical protein